MLRSWPALIVLVVGVVFILTAGANATIIWDFQNPPAVAPTIADVNAAGGLKVGDKLFSNFSVVPTQLNSGVAPDETAIRLTGMLLAGEWGIRFDGQWLATGGQLADTVIVFKAAADGQSLITDNTLAMTDYLAENGGSATISELVYARNPDMYNDPAIAHKQVYSTEFVTQDFDHQEFVDVQGAPLALQEIWIIKDIGVSGGVDPAGIASIDSFYQTFSQAPEPATMVLLLFGAAALTARRRPSRLG